MVKTIIIAFISLVLMCVSINAQAQPITQAQYAGRVYTSSSNITSPTSLPAADTLAGDHQYVFILYSGTSNTYTGAPSGWTAICTVFSTTANEVLFDHLNTTGEPSNNTWGVTSSTGSVTIYGFIIGGVTNTNGVDGASCLSQNTPSNTITMSAPTIITSGTYDLNVTQGNVNGSSPTLTFTGPASYQQWVPAVAGIVQGFYYFGVPTAVTYSNTGTALFGPNSAQISYQSGPASSNPRPNGGIW